MSFLAGYALANHCTLSYRSIHSLCFARGKSVSGGQLWVRGAFPTEAEHDSDHVVCDEEPAKCLSDAER